MAVNVNLTNGSDSWDAYSQGLYYQDLLILAFAGDDHVKGGARSDTIYGHSGNDILEGHFGPDTIYGGTENDTIYGNNSLHPFYGGWSQADTHDVLFGESGDDILYGGKGNDIHNGGADNDVVYGGSGDDIIEEDASVISGSGSDDYYGDGGGTTGSDTLIYKFLNLNEFYINKSGADVTMTDVYFLDMDTIHSDVDWIKFMDGTTLHFSQLYAVAL